VGWSFKITVAVVQQICVRPQIFAWFFYVCAVIIFFPTKIGELSEKHGQERPLYFGNCLFVCEVVIYFGTSLTLTIIRNHWMMVYLLLRDKQKPRETFVRAWPTSLNREYELNFARLTFSQWCWWRSHSSSVRVWCIVDWYLFKYNYRIVEYICEIVANI
jgi:hypothetical protein